MDIKNSMLLANMMSSKGGGSQIEYLQSDGAIYIPLCESGETLNVKRVVIDISYQEKSDYQVYFGRYYSRSGSYSNTHGIVGRQSPNFNIGFFDGSYTPLSSVQTPYDERRLEDFSFSAERIADEKWGIFGGSLVLTGEAETISYSICKIWSCILYNENGNEVANLLPKEENGVLGMYDNVRNKFIAGVGSGSFIAG